MCGAPGQDAELITLIKENWRSISKGLGILYEEKATRKDIDQLLLLCLCKQDNQSIVTAITQVIGEHWRNEIYSYVTDLSKKAVSSASNIKIHGAVKSTRLKDAALLVDHLSTKQDVMEIESKGCFNTKKWLFIVASCSVAFLILFFIAAVIAIPVLALRNPSYSKEILVLEGDTIILEKIKSFDYSEITVEEKVENGDSDHSIDAFLIPCDALTTWNTQIVFRSRNLTLTSPTYELGEQPGNTPIYLLGGSNITYTFRVWASMSELTPPFFVIFDNYNAYETFVSGNRDLSNAVFQQKLSVGSLQSPKLTETTYSVTKHGYYYVTGFSEAGVAYQFNATDNVNYLNVTDYIDKYSACHFSSGVTCSFQTSDHFLGTQTELCLIAHIYKPPADDPPSTHIVVSVKKAQALLLFPGIVAAVSLVIVMVVVPSVYVAAIVRKRSKNRYGYFSVP